MFRGWQRSVPAATAMALVAIAVLGSACATAPHSAATAPARSVAAPEPASDPGDGEGDENDDGSSATPSAADSDDSNRVMGETGEQSGPCPADMALVEVGAGADRGARRFCVDRYEASLVEVLGDGTERPFPHYLPVDGHDVRAVSRPHAFPQGYISEVQAQDACAASNKRLCKVDEWKTACMGPSHTTFPYGDARRPGTCNDTGKSAVIAVFGAKAVAASTPYAAPAAAAPVGSGTSGKRAHATKGRAAQSTRPRATAAKSTTAGKSAASKASSKKLSHRAGAAGARKGAASQRPSNVDPGVWAKLNDPGLGQVDGALAKTGEHAECVNGYGVFDMVGNLHEWVATDPSAVHGTFAGGYYLDTTLNGDGCNYRTVAHAHDYHDYSTGFRCCASAQTD